MKCPKNFNNKMHQQTLPGMWFHKNRSNLEDNNESDAREHSILTKFKSPGKLPPSKHITNSENSDDTIIESSQDSHKTRAKHGIYKTSSKKNKASQSSFPESSEFRLPGSPSKRLSFSELSEVSSTVIKEEIVELLDDMQDFESIEMVHNLSDLIADTSICSNILDCATPIGHIVKMEPFIENENMNADGPLKDPLQIDDEIEKETQTKPTVKEKRIKKTAISKLKQILPKSKNLSNKKKLHQIDHKSKTINKSSRFENDETKKIDSAVNLISEKQTKILKTLKIQLQHQVPPQHMIENSAAARNLDRKQISLFEKYGPLKRGPYTREEDKIIIKNWNMFCNVHGWDENNVEPFLYTRHEGKYYIPDIEERKNFVRFLANGLPWRSLHSVYYRFRNIYNTTVNNGPYTAKEDKKILSYMSKTSNGEAENNFAVLAKLLNRKRQSIYTRYQRLKTNYNLNSTSGTKIEKEDEPKKKLQKERKRRKSSRISLLKIAPQQIFTDVKWTSPLVKKFIDSIIELSACGDLIELKNQKLENEVWKKMEKKISINRATLRNFWYLQLHMQLFSPTPIYLNDTKAKLIEYMYNEKFEDLQEINWESICDHFNGVTSLFLSKLFEQLMNSTKENVEGSSLSDALEYLHSNYVPRLKEKSVDAVLPKLCYHSGKIICIDKGSEKKIPNKFTTNPFCDEDEL